MARDDIICRVILRVSLSNGKAISRKKRSERRSYVRLCFAYCINGVFPSFSLFHVLARLVTRLLVNFLSTDEMRKTRARREKSERATRSNTFENERTNEWMNNEYSQGLALLRDHVGNGISWTLNASGTIEQWQRFSFGKLYGYVSNASSEKNSKFYGRE